VTVISTDQQSPRRHAERNHSRLHDHDETATLNYATSRAHEKWRAPVKAHS